MLEESFVTPKECVAVCVDVAVAMAERGCWNSVNNRLRTVAFGSGLVDVIIGSEMIEKRQQTYFNAMYIYRRCVFLNNRLHHRPDV